MGGKISVGITDGPTADGGGGTVDVPPRSASGARTVVVKPVSALGALAADTDTHSDTHTSTDTLAGIGTHTGAGAHASMRADASSSALEEEVMRWQRRFCNDGYFDASPACDILEYLEADALADLSRFVAQSLEAHKPVRWKRGELLGSGAYGRVYLGLNEDDGTLMAAKQIPLHRLEDSNETVLAMEREIRLMSRLHHPNIVQYIGSQRDEYIGAGGAVREEYLTIFMEYVPGGSIASLLKRFGRLNDTLVRIYTKQILTGLAYLHAHAVVHRDIKGGNILVDRSGVCKLSDFGASKSLTDLEEGTSTPGPKSLKGTPAFMSPEVIKQTGYGRKSDIWSVGCTVIEMATGRPPWSNYDNPVAAMFAIAVSNDMPKLPGEISPEGAAFLNLCFHRDPAQRPTAAQLLRHPFITGEVDTSASIVCSVSPSSEQAKTPTAASDVTLAVTPETSVVSHGASGHAVTESTASTPRGDPAIIAANTGFIGSIEPPYSNTGGPDAGSDSRARSGSGTAANPYARRRARTPVAADAPADQAARVHDIRPAIPTGPGSVGVLDTVVEAAGTSSSGGSFPVTAQVDAYQGPAAPASLNAGAAAFMLVTPTSGAVASTAAGAAPARIRAGGILNGRASLGAVPTPSSEFSTASQHRHSSSTPSRFPGDSVDLASIAAAAIADDAAARIAREQPTIIGPYAPRPATLSVPGGRTSIETHAAEGARVSAHTAGAALGIHARRSTPAALATSGHHHSGSNGSGATNAGVVAGGSAGSVVLADVAHLSATPTQAAATGPGLWGARRSRAGGATQSAPVPSLVLVMPSRGAATAPPSPATAKGSWGQHMYDAEKDGGTGDAITRVNVLPSGAAEPASARSLSNGSRTADRGSGTPRKQGWFASFFGKAAPRTSTASASTGTAAAGVPKAAPLTAAKHNADDALETVRRAVEDDIRATVARLQATDDTMYKSYRVKYLDDSALPAASTHSRGASGPPSARGAGEEVGWRPSAATGPLPAPAASRTVGMDAALSTGPAAPSTPAAVHGSAGNATSIGGILSPSARMAAGQTVTVVVPPSHRQASQSALLGSNAGKHRAEDRHRGDGGRDSAREDVGSAARESVAEPVVLRTGGVLATSAMAVTSSTDVAQHSTAREDMPSTAARAMTPSQRRAASLPAAEAASTSSSATPMITMPRPTLSTSVGSGNLAPTTPLRSTHGLVAQLVLVKPSHGSSGTLPDHGGASTLSSAGASGAPSALMKSSSMPESSRGQTTPAAGRAAAVGTRSLRDGKPLPVTVVAPPSAMGSPPVASAAATVTPADPVALEDLDSPRRAGSAARFGPAQQRSSLSSPLALLKERSASRGRGGAAAGRTRMHAASDGSGILAAAEASKPAAHARAESAPELSDDADLAAVLHGSSSGKDVGARGPRLAPTRDTPVYSGK